MLEVTHVAVFLIQVSGEVSTHEEIKVEQWWQEPIERGVYINYHWKDKKRRDAWESIREGDKVLIYCTGSVGPYPSQISHVFTVEKVELGDEKATLHLVERKELPTGMPLDVVKEKIESGELSEEMRRCGTQGFNIGKVEESDLETILKWSESSGVLKEEVEVSRESDLQRYFRGSPGKIEEGLQVVDPVEGLA